MKYFDYFINACERVGYLDSVSKEGDTYTLIGCGKELQIKERFPKDGGVEVLLWSKANPTELRKVVGSSVEKVLPRLVVQHFTGLKTATYIDSSTNQKHFFKDVGIFPVFNVDSCVVFSDCADRKWICSTSNVPNVTMAFYKVLYDGRCDMSALMMPQLERKDDVKVFSSGSGELEYKVPEERRAYISSVADFERSIPNLREYMTFPHEEAVPDCGVSIVSGLAVSSKDTESINSANRKISGFIGKVVSSRPVTVVFGKGKKPVQSGLKIFMNFDSYKPWSGAQYTYDILEGEGLLEQFEAMMEELYPDGIEEVQLNDILWHDKDRVFEFLGLSEDGEDRNVPGVNSSAKRPVKSSVKLPIKSSVSWTDRTMQSLISKAEIFKLKLNETGTFDIDLGNMVEGQEVYSSFHGSVDAGSLIACAKRDGFSYTDLLSGVDLSKSYVLPDMKKLVASSHKLRETKNDSATVRNVEAWVVSGKDLQGELDKWGLDNPGGIFQSVKVLGVSFDGKSTFPVNSARPVKSSPMKRFGGEGDNYTFFGGGGEYGAGSDLDVAVQYISDIYPGGADFDTIGSTLWESGKFGDDEDSVMDLAYLVCDQLGVPVNSSLKRKPVKSGKRRSVKSSVGTDDDEILQWIMDEIGCVWGTATVLMAEALKASSSVRFQQVVREVSGSALSADVTDEQLESIWDYVNTETEVNSGLTKAERYNRNLHKTFDYARTQGTFDDEYQKARSGGWGEDQDDAGSPAAYERWKSARPVKSSNTGGRLGFRKPLTSGKGRSVKSSLYADDDPDAEAMEEAVSDLVSATGVDVVDSDFQDGSAFATGHLVLGPEESDYVLNVNVMMDKLENGKFQLVPWGEDSEGNQFDLLGIGTIELNSPAEVSKYFDQIKQEWEREVAECEAEVNRYYAERGTGGVASSGAKRLGFRKPLASGKGRSVKSSRGEYSDDRDSPENRNIDPLWDAADELMAGMGLKRCDWDGEKFHGETDHEYPLELNASVIDSWEGNLFRVWVDGESGKKDLLDVLVEGPRDILRYRKQLKEAWGKAILDYEEECAAYEAEWANSSYGDDRDSPDNRNVDRFEIFASELVEELGLTCNWDGDKFYGESDSEYPLRLNVRIPKDWFGRFLRVWVTGENFERDLLETNVKEPRHILSYSGQLKEAWEEACSDYEAECEAGYEAEYVESSVAIQSDLKGLIQMVGNWLKRVHDGLMEQNVFYQNLMRLLRGNGWNGKKANEAYEALIAGQKPEAVLSSLQLKAE